MPNDTNTREKPTIKDMEWINTVFLYFLKLSSS